MSPLGQQGHGAVLCLAAGQWEARDQNVLSLERGSRVRDVKLHRGVPPSMQSEVWCPNHISCPGHPWRLMPPTHDKSTARSRLYHTMGKHQISEGTGVTAKSHGVQNSPVNYVLIQDCVRKLHIAP